MVLAKLREGRCTPRYLSKELGKSQPYINQRLKNLKNSNYVRKIDRGLYAHSELSADSLDASKKVENLTVDELIYLSDRIDENETIGIQDNQNISQKKLQHVKRVMKNKIPRSSDAREVIVDAIHTLNRKGKLSRNELEQELYSKHSGAYKNSTSLWESTVGQKYKDIPGLQKTDGGLYYFDQKDININSELSEDLNQWSE